MIKESIIIDCYSSELTVPRSFGLLIEKYPQFFSATSITPDCLSENSSYSRQRADSKISSL